MFESFLLKFSKTDSTKKKTSMESFAPQRCQMVKVWQLSATANRELSWRTLGNLSKTSSITPPKSTKHSIKHVITDTSDIMKA